MTGLVYSCNKCGADNRVVQTRKVFHEDKQVIWRRRRCHRCGHGQFTAEIAMSIADAKIFKHPIPKLY